jgi:Zn-dependent M16 (insulinase) family peptidase
LQVATLHQLKAEPATFWLKLFHGIFSPSKYACVEAEPSKAAVEELSQREDERIEAQCERLGEDGLKQCGTDIEAAIRLNTVQFAD